VGKILPTRADEQSMQTSTHGPFTRAGVPVPARSSGPASLRRIGAEGDVELTPERVAGSNSQQLRIVGPGRRERAYRDSIAQLEQVAREKQAALRAASLVERGTARFVDRLERERESDREQLQDMQAQGNRLLVALGAMQRENERLAEELRDARTRIAAPRAKGLRGLLGRLLR